MPYLNRVCIMGHVGQDPDIKIINNGNTVANFSVATTEYFMKNNVQEKRTEWHKVVAFQKLAEIVQKYIRKGVLVYIEGKLQTRSWDDKDGKKHYTTEIMASNILSLQQEKAETPANNERKETSWSGSTAENYDDVPFN